MTGYSAPFAARSRERIRDTRFLITAAAAVFAVVFAGFARTYYLRAWLGKPALPWLPQLHGALMTSWFVLYFAQTTLVATHRVRWHKRLGVFGAVLALSMVIVGATVALRDAARDAHKPVVAGPPPPQVLGFFLFVLLVFAILVVAALLLRRRRDYHSRLMLLACLAMVGPGLARIPFQRIPAVAFLRTGGPGDLFGMDSLLLYSCVAYDTWRHRRLHPAFAFGALLLLAEDLPLIWMAVATPTWAYIAARLTS